MKRLLIFAGISILLLLLTAAVIAESAFMGWQARRQTIADGVEIDGIRIVKDGMVTIAVVPTDANEVALIDAGSDASGKAILAELSRRHLGPEAVTAILLTHGHRDHTASIHLFGKARVMVLEPDVALVEGTSAAGGPLPRLMPVRPTGVVVTRALHDGDTVTLGHVAIRVFAVPGHTQGSAAYLVNGVLFLGDAADMYNDGAMKASAWMFTDNPEQDRDSLVRLDRRLVQEGADVKAMEFAHGGMVAKGLVPLDEFRRRNPGRNQ